MEKIIFVTKNFRKKANIIITEERWNDHIIKEHPAIKPYLSNVKQCIKNPELIKESVKDKYCEIYYKKSGIKSGSFKNLYIACVIYWEIKIWWRKIIHKGRLKTAYLTPYIIKKGRIRWQKPQ